MDDDARTLPRFSAPQDEQPLPPLSGEALRLLYNAGFFEVITRLLAFSLPSERARERAIFLRTAAALMPEVSTYAKIRALIARMELLTLEPHPHLAAGTIDGALGVALILNSSLPPSISTVQRALSSDPTMV